LINRGGTGGEGETFQTGNETRTKLGKKRREGEVSNSGGERDRGKTRVGNVAFQDGKGRKKQRAGVEKLTRGKSEGQRGGRLTGQGG